MNLLAIDREIDDFIERIASTLNLNKCTVGMLVDQKKLYTWVTQQSRRLKKLIHQYNQVPKSYGERILSTLAKKQKHVQKDPLQIDLALLSGFIKKGTIPKGFAFVSKDVPEDIINTVNALKGKKFQNYYGFVKSPFMSDYFIMKKQDFHTVVESVQKNQLKFLMIEEKDAHRYQRNLVQQIFGRVFRQKGCLSLVMKIQVNFDPLEPPYNLFCYIQDRKLKDQISWQPLSSLHKNFNKLQIETKQKTLQLSQIGILEIFLSQILVLPLQSLVSDFIVWIKQSEAQLVKCNQQNQQQIIKQKNLKDHPSLRNPLLYFRQYIHEHSIKISEAQKLTINSQLYSCFYRCLEVVVEVILTDFSTEANDIVINSSACFNQEVFSALWITFHKISLLSGWMKQVIEPIKNTITISEVIQHFCPIFNQISVYEAENFENYRQFFLNLQMESYLATVVKKTSLEKYKDMYVTAGQTVINKKLTQSPDIYDHIFRPILHQANLLYSDPVQVAYIFNFCCKIYFQYQPIPSYIQQKWKNQTIWEKSIKYMQKQQLLFIDIGFDFMAFACGINSYQIDSKSFERIKFTPQTQIVIQGVKKFVQYVRQYFQAESDRILSSLLQKSFKHKKFKICTVLLQNDVQIRDFKQIIKTEQVQQLINQQMKQNILKTIQQQSPQMHRLYTWQQILLVHLKKQQYETIQVDTLQYGKIFLPKQIFTKNIKNGKVINNLSRKDYRFNINKQIAHIDLGNGISFYLQSGQFPLMLYFYKIFLTQLSAQQLIFNFTSFFYENKMYIISQYLPRGVNYKKGLLTYTEEELNSMTSIQFLSQAIILSMILLPCSIKLQDLIICPSSQNYGQIFIVDWHTFYNKNFMCRYLGKARLNTRNSMFLMQIMHRAIHPKIIKKYKDIDAMKICESIFNQSKKFSQSIHQLYKKYVNINQPTKQHLALIFQSGFIFNLAERMFKIKRAFNQKTANFKKGLTFYQTLQILHSQTSYYYQQVYSTSVSLRQREFALEDQVWKRSFLHSNIIQFFGEFRKLQEIQNLFPDHYYRFCFQGPTQSLADATAYVKKFKAFTSQNPQIYKNYNNQFFEYIMKHIDISRYNEQQRQQFMLIIKNKSLQYLQSSDRKVLPLSFIRLNSIQFLQKMYLDNFSFERVQQLIIEACTLNTYDIKSFPNTLRNVVYLQLRDIKRVKYIGQNTISGQPIQIKHLKTLSIIDCNQLISIDLKCDILECLQLRNNQQLQTVYIHSLDLKNIYIYNNPNIALQNIGIYIIKGINVLLCRSSCRGGISQLYSTNYDTYVNNILKKLLISFFVKQNRYIMLLTLCKMKQVNQNLFARAGITTFKPMTFIFNRFTAEVQDSLLAQIFRIYFSNHYLNQIVIGQFLIQIYNAINSLQISRLFKVISQGLAKLSTQKPFNCLKFQNSQTMFQSLQQMQVKTFIDLLKTQKHMTLQFQNLNILAHNLSQMNKQVQLIRYISMQKDQIQKITLNLKNSNINTEFFNRIFKDTLTLQEMKRKQQQLLKNSVRAKVSRLMTRRSINQQYPKHMKINRISLENCQIQDTNDKQQLQKDLTLSHNNEQIDTTQIQAMKSKQPKTLQIIQKSESLPFGLIQAKQTTQINIQKQKEKQKQKWNTFSINMNIDKYIKSNTFRSVKQLRLIKCTLQSFSMLSYTPNLILLSIIKCKIVGSLSLNRNTNLTMDQFYKQIKCKQLQYLQLQQFYTNTLECQKSFNIFCEILTQIKTLKILKLNKNTLTFNNLLQLNKYINQTSIQQLQLDRLQLFQKTKDHKISYLQQKIQLIQQLRSQKQQKNAMYLQQFLANTKYLKSLLIQLNSLKYIQQFIKSISTNTSIIHLKLHTIYQIPSYILTPFNNNNSLTHISSNMQLPIWLLTHVYNNRTSIIANKKNKIHNTIYNEYAVMEQQQQDINNMNINVNINQINSNSNNNSNYYNNSKQGITIISQLNNTMLNNSRYNDCYRMGLSLDGGGIRGMLLATQLDYIAKSVGYPLHKIFDCIGGTSIGGILALLSTGTLDGYNPMAAPHQLMELFSKFGKDIFKKSQFRQFRSLFDTKYSPASFEEVLKNYFKDCKLSNCLEQTSVIVTAVNRMDNKDYIFRSNQALLNRQKDFYMRDVARATSAAPTYFPSAQIKNVNATLKLSMLDGGVGMNNPSKLVIDQVMKISSNSAANDNYFLLSLGTGRLPSQTIPQSAGLKDISPIIDSFAQSSNYFLQRDLSINYKGHFYRVSPSIVIADKSKGELDNTSDEIIEVYRQTGLQASKKYFNNTVIFGKYRNMNLIQWLRQNTQRKYQY